MKKSILTFALSLLLIFILNVSSNAIDYTELWENVDDQTIKYLEDIGINEMTFDELFNVTPTRVIKFIFELAFEKGISIIPNVIKMIAVIIVFSIGLSFLKETNNLTNLISIITTLILLSLIIVPISRMLTDIATGIKTSTVFINSYLPIMTSIIIASKNPSLAITYNSFSLFLSSIIANVADKFLIPIIGGMLSFNIISSISFENYKGKIFKTIRKFIVIILSLFSTVFTGILTTQSILSYSSDSIVMKGIKFVSGTFIPVVGSNVGDAISSVLSSFVIMKNTLGVFIIIIIILINLPIMVELLIFYFVLEFLSIIASMLGMDSISEIFDSISSVISILNIIMFFITFILVISTGIIIVMGK